MFKDVFHKFIFPAFPRLYLSENYFNLLRGKKTLNIEFVDDYFIYKNIDNGYSALYGEFNLIGEKVFFNDFSEDISNLAPHLQEEIHKFNWLQDLKIVENEVATSKLKDLILGWIDNYENLREKVIYDQCILGIRLFNCLTSQQIIRLCTETEKIKILNSLSLQIRLFLKIYKLDNSINTVSTCKTLFVISRALNDKSLSHTALNSLIHYIESNLLEDGANKSKCPYITLNHLEDMVYIYKNLRKDDTLYANKLRIYIDKMTVFIKTVRYKDGRLGVFYEGFEGDGNKIDFTLSLCRINAKPYYALRHAGYLTLYTKSGISALLKTSEFTKGNSDFKKIDNSVLSQEISIGKERIFINNSSKNPYFKEDSNTISREYYSTMLFYDSKGLVNMPSKLSNIDCKVEQRKDNAWNSALAVYKALKSSHGIMWHKSISVEKENGDCLLGEDFLTIDPNHRITKAVLQFILHPRVIIKEISEDNNIIFLSVNEEEWIFSVTDNINVSKNIYKGIQGEVLQNYIITIDLDMRKKNCSVEWSLTKVSTIVNSIDKNTKNLSLTDNVKDKTAENRN